MMEKSLDPRLNRLGLMNLDKLSSKEQLDQLPTFEVFVQPNEKRAYQHEGIVHAVNPEMAFMFAKEQFSRRYTCSGIWTVSTEEVFVSSYSDDQQSVYETVTDTASTSGKTAYLIFHMMKRGKQHKFAGEVMADSYEQALSVAKRELDPGKPVLNIWVIKDEDIYKTTEEDKQIWATLQEKQFREATDYRGADKIKQFKEESKP
jgi:ring-1,2-phenylacetyl-CoA epoxidase subunit PaaB